MKHQINPKSKHRIIAYKSKEISRALSGQQPQGKSTDTDPKMFIVDSLKQVLMTSQNKWTQ